MTRNLEGVPTALSAAFGFPGSRLTVLPGCEIFRQADRPSDVFLLDRGFVKLVRAHANGREVMVGLCEPQRLLGAEAAVVDRAHECGAVAITRCQLRRLGTPEFRDLVRSQAELSWDLHRQQSEALVQQIEMSSGFGSLTARERLAGFLESMLRELPVIPTPGGSRIRLPLRYCEIAQLIRVTPQYLSRLLDELEREGVLVRKTRWLIPGSRFAGPSGTEDPAFEDDHGRAISLLNHVGASTRRRTSHLR